MNDKELIAEARERAGYMALLAELTKNEPGAVTAREEADRMTRFADALEAAQNNNSRLERELLDHASHIGTLGEQVKNLVKALDAVEDEKRSLADRLAALTTPQDGGDALEARQPSENDREALARVMDTLAYYHCRSVNPKADHPRMGYHAMTEDQREHLREKQREAAEEIMRMIPSLSRAAVPDAAPEAKQPEGWSTEDRQEAKREAERRWSRPVMREAEQRYQAGIINGFMLGAEWQKARETFISYKAIADKARAERDAALSTVAKVRELHQPAWDSVSAMYPTPLCGCGEEYRECPTVQVLPPSLAINAGGLNPEGMTP